LGLTARRRGATALDRKGKRECRYSLDSQNNVWYRPESPAPFAGTDPAIDRIRDLVLHANDTSSGSHELFSGIEDWASLIQLSPERANIIRPAAHLLRGRILELGAECGALTRFLAETGCEVFAVEPDPSKAAVAARRCSGLPNVSVYSDELLGIAGLGWFDVVVLANPTAQVAPELLRHCGSLLTDDGILLSAPANGLALKYLAGAPDEQSGYPFKTITDPQARICGRRDWQCEFERAGFGYTEFLYVLPDHRFARLLLHPEALQDVDAVTDLVQRFATSHDPRWDYERLFSERLAWATILRNGLGDEFAHSFFVAASKTRPSKSLLREDVLAYMYTAMRRRCFQKENLLARKSGGLVVSRRKLYADLPPDGQAVKQQLNDEPFIRGRLWVNELYEKLDVPGWSFQTLLEWFEPYCDFLLQSAAKRDAGLVLPDTFLDCTPFNLIRKLDNGWEPFDLEWTWHEPVPLDWVLFRSILYALNGTLTVAEPHSVPDLHIMGLALQLLAGVGFPLTPERVNELFALEEIQQRCAAGDHVRMSRLYWENATLLPRRGELREELRRKEAAVTELTKRLHAAESECATAQLHLRDRERQLRFLDQTLSGRVSQWQKLSDTVREREAALEGASQRIGEIEKECATVRLQLDDRNRQVSFLDDSLAQQHAKLQELAREVESHEKLAAAAESKLGALIYDVRQHEQRASRAEGQLAGVRDEFDALIRAIRDISAAIGRRDDDLCREHARVEVFQNQYAAAEARIRELTGTLAVVQGARTTLEHLLAECREQLTEQSSGTEALQKKLIASESRIAELSSTAAELQGSRSALEMELDERGDRMATLEQTLADREAQLAQCERQIQDLEHDVEELRSVLVSMDAELGERQSHIGVVEQEVGYRDAQLAELDRRTQALDHKRLSLSLELTDSQRKIQDQLVIVARAAERTRKAIARFNEIAVRLSAEQRQRSLDGSGNARRIKTLQSQVTDGLHRASELRSELHRVQLDAADQHRLVGIVRNENLRIHTEMTAMRESETWALARRIEAARLFVRNGWHRLLRPAVTLRAAWLARKPEVVREREVIADSGLFDAEYYLSVYSDVKRSGLAPLEHYLIWGANQGRNPNRLFDSLFYRHRCGGAPGTDNDLVHWLKYGLVAGLVPHPLFDAGFYLAANPDVREAGINPLSHFLSQGGSEGRDPHPLFDSSYYQERYPDVVEHGVNPLVHYLEHGHREGRTPNPLFDGRFYCDQRGRLSCGEESALAHFAQYGFQERVSPHPLFDSEYYLNRYPDLIPAGVNPLVHYLEHGGAEGRDPHPLFDARYYCSQFPSGMPSNCNPLLHYIQDGVRQKYDPHPLFQTSFYLSQCPTLQTSPLEHYVRHGAFEGVDPHELFSSSYYLDRNPDVAKSRVNPLAHYLKTGSLEGRRPNPWFDPAWYRKQYPQVAALGVDPLVHYLLLGVAEGKNPNPNFDTRWYLETYPDVAEAGRNPLAHYVRSGFLEGRETLPTEAPAVFVPAPEVYLEEADDRELTAEEKAIRQFFDEDYYRAQCPDLGDVSPYRHYLDRGAREGKNPHPLFETGYYLRTYPDVAQGPLNPLVHFIEFGSSEGRNPHPLFHTTYYLASHPEVRKSGVSPLLHYILVGYREGCRPNPMFDSAYYLSKNPDVAASNTNPLIHFIAWGAWEGRSPHPQFDVRRYFDQYPELFEKRINPLIHYFQAADKKPSDRASASPTGSRRRSDCYSVRTLDSSTSGNRPFSPQRTILCVTHVAPYPPRAGNEYAEYRRFQYFERLGYRIVLLLSPLPGEELSENQIRAVCERFPYTIVCGRDGLLQHCLPEGRDVVSRLNGMVPRPLPQRVDESRILDASDQALEAIERTFCHQFLVHLALHMEAALSSCVVLSQYIFHTRFLPYISPSSLKIIETHDMFSTKRRKVVQFGVGDGLDITAEQERHRLLRADLILACQSEEAKEFAALVPERDVLEVPFDFDVSETIGPPVGARILCVASDNALNAKGLRDFLNFAWPLILRDFPSAELLVAGKVCRTVDRDRENVRLLGLVDDLESLYERATMTINPAVAGTGLKIKTAESLCHFRPSVSWPAGVDGLDPKLANLCRVARDWPAFASAVVAVLRSSRRDWFTMEEKDQIRELFSPEAIYRPVIRYLDNYWTKQRLCDGGMKARTVAAR
jgi:hypothetical protein